MSQLESLFERSLDVLGAPGARWLRMSLGDCVRDAHERTTRGAEGQQLRAVEALWWRAQVDELRQQGRWPARRGA